LAIAGIADNAPRTVEIARTLNAFCQLEKRNGFTPVDGVFIGDGIEGFLKGNRAYCPNKAIFKTISSPKISEKSACWSAEAIRRVFGTNLRPFPEYSPRVLYAHEPLCLGLVAIEGICSAFWSYRCVVHLTVLNRAGFLSLWVVQLCDEPQPAQVLPGRE